MFAEEGAFIIVAAVCFSRAAVQVEDMGDLFVILVAIEMKLGFDAQALQFLVHRLGGKS